MGMSLFCNVQPTIKRQLNCKRQKKRSLLFYCVTCPLTNYRRFGLIPAGIGLKVGLPSVQFQFKISS